MDHFGRGTSGLVGLRDQLLVVATGEHERDVVLAQGIGSD
jgi:hypothetical protein